MSLYHAESINLRAEADNTYTNNLEEKRALLEVAATLQASSFKFNLEPGDTNAEQSGLSDEESQHSGAQLKNSGCARLFLLFCKVASLLLFVFLSVHEALHFLDSKPCDEEEYRKPVCTPELWSNGHWLRRNLSSMPLQPPISSYSQLLKISNFPGPYCANNRLPFTNTGLPRLENDTVEFWDWRYRVSSYEWRSGCDEAGLSRKSPTPEQLIEKLVTEGGWLLIGDSLSAQWFLSLSCFLAPYVYSVPFWTLEVPWDSPQHMYLKPNTTLAQKIKRPLDFDPVTTPLISILRHPQIQEIVAKHNLIADELPLWGDDIVFDMEPSQYLADFLDPKLRYSQLIASAGAHYTQRLFQGRSLHKISEIFHYSFKHWSELILQTLEDPRARNKKVFYRTATAGHHECHKARRTGPWNEVEVLETLVWNWQTIPLFNKIADSVLKGLKHSKFKLLSIERPAMLRPDAVRPPIFG
ncbi:hypothetical protein O181_008606 [Austropuccinia psidii MF-1]|uniref:Uncharacterized protein n=1 Tax=Austropuccinia psidii MF-1 TaxID=1389203 RepID=A0A9Q3BQ66_9BASI|nr:hypothetical protein [Austropuccinia psidii MF-1]